jgi:hypothetical protein
LSTAAGTLASELLGICAMGFDHNRRKSVDVLFRHPPRKLVILFTRVFSSVCHDRIAMVAQSFIDWWVRRIDCAPTGCPNKLDHVTAAGSSSHRRSDGKAYAGKAWSPSGDYGFFLGRPRHPRSGG